MSYNYYDNSDSDSDSDVEEISEEEDELDGSPSSSAYAPSQSADDASVASGSQGSGGHVIAPSEQGSSVSCPPFTAVGSNISSHTSYERNPSASSRSRSPSPTTSVISLTDSIRTAIYKEEYGRGLNNYCEVYRLPADEEEWERLEKQHHMFIDIMQGKYPPPMIQIMQRQSPACLDLGCGNGGWAKDVARDFPQCEVVALDLVPIADTTNFPPNMRSEVDDINLGLQHFFGEFDVVHCRLIASGIRDYQLMIEDISRILRPGGLIEVAEFDFHMYDVNHKRIDFPTMQIRGPPWWGRWMVFLNLAIQQSGGDVDAATHLFTWISNHRAFENVVYREYWLPVVPGTDHDYNDPVYTKMKDDVLAFLRSGRPLLLGSGLAEDAVDILEQNAIRELHESETPQYTRLQCVYATRRHGVVLD